MTEKIKIAIAGYGNLGRGVEAAIRQNPDMALVAVATRRDPASLRIATESARVVRQSELETLQDEVDVMIACGGSATDLPAISPQLARVFNLVDSFDTHAKIPEHFAAVDAAAKAGGRLSLISAGWDPGMFSIARTYAEAILPEGDHRTFWGRGVSQGHSDAIRRIPGVLDARQYTVPIDEAVTAARNGSREAMTARQMHRRECYVVAEDGADCAKIEETIKTMPNYFADYDTTVTFITAAEMAERHSALPHGGFVIRSGVTGKEKEHRHTVEFGLKLDSNPEFTASVLVAYARAVYRLRKRGEIGCRTVLDIAPALLSTHSPEELRKRFL